MPAKIIPQSGVLEVQGRIKANSAVNDLDILTKKDFATKKEVQFRAGQTTASFPKVIAVKISDGYEGDLPQGQVYSSETDTILGIANQTLANGSNYFLITNGVVSFNTTGANINDPVYADASTGNLSLIAAAKKVGVVLEVGVNGKVLINLGGESSSGGAGGDTNFIVDPNAAGGDANKFIEYLNAGTTPTNGSGGSASNISFAKETASPLLRTAGDWKLTKAAANGQGEGIAYDFDIEPGFVGRTLELTFNYSTSVNYVSSDIGVFIYDKTNFSLIATNINDVSQTMGRPGTFICKFPATSSSLRIIFHVRTTNALAYTFSFSDLSVRPESRVIGAAVSDAIQYDATFSAGFGTITNKQIFYKRIGDMALIFGSFTVGTTSATAATIDLPSGLTIDQTKVITSGRVTSLGWFTRKYATGYQITNDGLTAGIGNIIYDATLGTNKLRLASAVALNVYQAQNVNDMIASTDNISFHAQVPISGWSSNISVIQNATEFAYNTNTSTNLDNTTDFGYGPEGTNFVSIVSSAGVLKKRARFRSPIQISDKIEVEVWNGNGWQSLPHADLAGSSGKLIDLFQGDMLNGSDSYTGVGYKIVNSTDVDVVFGRNAVGRNYSSITYYSDITSFKWRVRKSSGSVVAEIPPFVGAKYSGTTAAGLTANVTTHKFNTKEYDTYNAYNTTTGVYTIPLTGYYRITTTILVNAISTFYFWVNGIQRNSGEATASANYSATGSAEFYLNAGDTIDIRQDNNVSTVTVSFPHFSISKIG